MNGIIHRKINHKKSAYSFASHWNGLFMVLQDYFITIFIVLVITFTDYILATLKL